MLTDTIPGQLVAERQRGILDEAALRGLARQGRAVRPAPSLAPLRRLATSIRIAALVRVRPIRPEDTELLREGFERLSAQSRRQRFFVAKKALSAKELRYFTDVDHHDHEALVAVRRFGGDGLAVARFIRDRVDRDAADVAVTVVDEWQSRGLGTALVTRLAARARCEGVHRFTASILEENDGARRLLPKVGTVRLVGRDRDSLDYEIALAPVAAERRAYRWTLLGPAATPAGCA